VKIKSYGKEIILVSCFLLLFSAFTFAAEVRIQGKVDELDLKKDVMVVNEKAYTWDINTKFYNENALPIAKGQFKINHWVYIEGVTVRKGSPIAIKKIYLLPGYIGMGDRDKYPFMQ